MRLVFLVLALLLGIAPSARAISLGAGVLGDLPSGDMADVADYGYGLYGNLDRGLAPVVNLRFQVETNQFVGEGAHEDFTTWGFLGGVKASLVGILSGGVLTGYYTEVDEWDLVPFATVKLGMFDVGAQYKMLGDSKWFGARAGLSFGTPGI